MVENKSQKRITTRYVAQLPLAESSSKPVFYFDNHLKGFGVKVTSTGKKFIVDTKVQGKTVRVNIGSYTVISVEDARKRASALLGEMKNGTNPNVKKRVKKNTQKTFSDICKEYLECKPLKPLTRRDYEKHTSKTLADWYDKSFLEIDSDAAILLYRKLVEREITRGGVTRQVSPAQANQAFRFARAVFKFAKRHKDDARLPLLRENPIDILSENGLWDRVAERTNFVTKTQLKKLWKALWALKNDERTQDRETIRDLLLLILFTGLRLGEARDMKWEHVDLVEGTLTIFDPKNHHNHVLPLSDYLLRFFKQRKQKAAESAWVFPAARKEGKAQVQEFRKTIASVCEASGVVFTPHDLRRTFLTYADSMPARYSVFFTKRLANHKVNDVTSKYVRITLDDLRQCMQDITNFILQHADARRHRLGMFDPPAPDTPQKRIIRIKRNAPEVVTVSNG